MRTSAAFELSKYYVLLALAERPSYGYEIQDQIIGDTVGLYLRETTIYSVLRSLEEQGYIERVPSEGKARIYKLTDKGRRILELHSRTLLRTARLAQERLRYR